MPLTASFAAHLASLGLPEGGGLVAVSGGADSVALLDLLVGTGARGGGRELLVAHVDHGIHPESASVSRAVERLADSYGLECVVGRLELGAEAGETGARTARYRWLERLRLERGLALIFTGHHQDDQVETILMRVLAGSGPAGLAGMAARSGPMVRPLLPFGREQLVQYLQSRGVSFWDDPANQDSRHLRSWIRGKLLPLIRQRIPEADSRILRVGRQAAWDRRAWDALLNALPQLAWREEAGGSSVAAPVLAGYDSLLGGAVLRAMARRAGCTLGPGRAARALQFVRRGTSGRVLELGAGWRLELAFDRLHLEQLPAPDLPTAPFALAGPVGEWLWGDWRLCWRPEPAPDDQPRETMTAWFIPQELQVRAWRPGDRVKPLRGPGSRLVVRCFQEAKVPRSRRGTWPIFELGGQVVWVPGVCRSNQLLPDPGSEAVRIDVARR